MASAKLPTPDELKAVGRQLGINLSEADVAFFLETMGGSVAAYHAIDAHAAWRQRADEFSDTLKTTVLFGQYALNKYRGHYYAKSQNLARSLRAAYDAVLKDYDVLLMPTLPLKATPIPKADAPRMEVIQRAFEMLPNTAPFDVTGHPSMSVPCGLSDGLPAGMMLTGKHFDEIAIYRAASAFEKAGDWKAIRA